MENHYDADTLARSIKDKIVKGTDLISYYESDSKKRISSICLDLYDEIKSELLLLEKAEGKSKRYFEIHNFMCEALATFMNYNGQKIFLYSKSKDFNSSAYQADKEIYKLELKGMLLLMTTLLNECTSNEIKNKIKQYGDSLYLTMNRFEKKEGCFIATAALGDYNHPIVMDLRNFRDNWLLNRNWGKLFTNWYYKHSPYASRIIEKSFLLKKITLFVLITPLHYVVKNILRR